MAVFIKHLGFQSQIIFYVIKIGKKKSLYTNHYTPIIMTLFINGGYQITPTRGIKLEYTTRGWNTTIGWEWFGTPHLWTVQYGGKRKGVSKIRQKKFGKSGTHMFGKNAKFYTKPHQKA